MNNTHARQSVSIALTILTILLSAAKCDGKSGSVDTDRNPIDRAVAPESARTATIRASIKRGSGIPGEVKVEVTDADGNHESSDEILTVVGGEYVQTVTYTAGVVLNIHVEVKPNKPYSNAYCSITDGEVVVKIGPVTDSWRAICDLYTTQK